MFVSYNYHRLENTNTNLCFHPLPIIYLISLRFIIAYKTELSIAFKKSEGRSEWFVRPSRKEKYYKRIVFLLPSAIKAKGVGARYIPRFPLIVMPSPSKSTTTLPLSSILRSIIPSATLSSIFCSITLLKGRAPYSTS